VVGQMYLSLIVTGNAPDVGAQLDEVKKTPPRGVQFHYTGDPSVHEASMSEMAQYVVVNHFLNARRQLNSADKTNAYVLLISTTDAFKFDTGKLNPDELKTVRQLSLTNFKVLAVAGCTPSSSSSHNKIFAKSLTKDIRDGLVIANFFKCYELYIRKTKKTEISLPIINFDSDYKGCRIVQRTVGPKSVSGFSDILVFGDPIDKTAALRRGSTLHQSASSC
jgi:hypothetical protein